MARFTFKSTGFVWEKVKNNPHSLALKMSFRSYFLIKAGSTLDFQASACPSLMLSASSVTVL
jgi:hypothetical protein